jgi:serine/threonine protein kinase
MSNDYFRLLSDTLDESCNQGYYDRFFVEEQKLGRGQRGSVFKCRHILNGISLGSFAIKAIPVGSSQKWLMDMLKEVKLLEKLKHPNIIEYKHAWLEDRQLSVFSPKVPCLFILMELANGGNLEEYLHVQWNPKMDEAYYADLKMKRRRGIPNTLTESKDESQDEYDHARHYGGIGIGPHGRKIRYLTKREILHFFKDICRGCID